MSPKFQRSWISICNNTDVGDRSESSRHKLEEEELGNVRDRSDDGRCARWICGLESNQRSDLGSLDKGKDKARKR